MFSVRKFPDSNELPRYVAVLLGIAVAIELVTGVTARIEGADSASHLIWIQQFTDLLDRGVWLPKWLPDGFHGVGSPTFYFYPPLPYYAAWVISLCGIHDPAVLFRAVATLASIGSVWTCYLLLREYAVSHQRAIIGSLIYGFAPYRVAELFSRSSLSSHVGYAFIPLVALALVRAFDNEPRNSLRNIILLSVSTSALMLSSIPATACAACFGIVALATQWRRFSLRAALQLLFALVVTCGLTAFYWVSAVAHTGDAQISRFWKDPYYFVTELLRLHLTVELGQTAALVAIIVFVVLALRSDKRTTATTLMLSSVALVAVLQLPLVSLPLWRHIPLLQFIQVPWRLYIGLVLAVSVAIATVRSDRSVRYLSIAVIVLSLSAIGSSLPPLLNLHFFPHWVSTDADPPEYLSRNAHTDIVHHATFTSDDILHPAIDDPTPIDRITAITRTPTLARYDVTLSRPGTVHLRQLYWPLWVAVANGHELRSFEDVDGYHAVALPAGDYSLELHLRRSAGERASIWISAVSLLALFMLSIFSYRRHAPRDASTAMSNTQQTNVSPSARYVNAVTSGAHSAD